MGFLFLACGVWKGNFEEALVGLLMYIIGLQQYSQTLFDHAVILLFFYIVFFFLLYR